jgi:hypothetical protein
VFPEDVPIPEGPLRILWNTDEIDTRDCMAGFVARSLATWSAKEGGTALILHDLQRDLIRKRRENQLQSLHSRLLEGWSDLLKLPDTLRLALDALASQTGRMDGGVAATVVRFRLA